MSMYKDCPAAKYCRRPLDWIPWAIVVLFAVAGMGVYTVLILNFCLEHCF
jgi:hypothetical protein